MINAVLFMMIAASASAGRIHVDRNFTECDADCGGGERHVSGLGREKWSTECNTFPCDLAPPFKCGCAGADIIYVVDRSNSIKEPNYWRVKQFMIDFANAYEMVISDSVDKSNVRFAAVSFDRFAQEEFNLDEGLTLGNRDALIAKIWGMKYEPPQAGTNTPAGLLMANDILTTQGRPDKPQFVFVITDGRATKRRRLPAAIDAINSDSHSVYALGIGSIRVEEINKLVKHKEGHGFLVDDFQVLPQVLTGILDAFCCKTVREECNEEIGGCEPECGPGQQTVTQTCNVLDSDGNEIFTEASSYEQGCCNGPCPEITDYCSIEPCSPGACSERPGGYKCTFPLDGQCPVASVTFQA